MFDAQQFAARLSAREDRWPLLKGWAESWCASFQVMDGFAESAIDKAEGELGLKLPASLKQLYQFAGQRLSKLNDPLIKPEELEVAQGILPFWSENQYVVTWGIKLDDLTLDDPPVYIDLAGCDSYRSTYMIPNRLIHQNDTLSEFVFQMVLWDYMKWGDAYDKASGQDEVAKLLQDSQPLGFPEWTQEHFERGLGYTNVAVKFYESEARLVLDTAGKYARCVLKNKDSFLRHTTKGRY